MGVRRQRPCGYQRRAILVGKPDQDLVIAELCDHFCDGRLTMVELEARVEAALFARTDVRLAELLDDLPERPALPEPPPLIRHTNIRWIDAGIDWLRAVTGPPTGWPATH